MTNPYEDILYLPRPVSQTRARMSLLGRAAQFSPFAALTGFDGAVAETARLTREKICLDVDAWTELNRKLLWLRDTLEDMPKITVTYFVPDQRKEGGAYVTAEGRVQRMDTVEKWLVLEDGKKIPFGDILNVEGELFDE